MAEITVEETRLSEIVDELVRKHLKSSIDDVEELRRSPAGAILRLEERVEFIQKNMATKSEVASLKARVEAIEKNMATKADIASLRAEIAELRTEQNERTGSVEKTLGERIGNVETTLGERIGNVETTLGERIGNVETTLGERIGNVETTLGERIGNVEKTLTVRIGKLETGQKIMFTVLFTFFSAIIAMLIKLVFFP